MSNENCLTDVCCPKCGQEDRFRITALITCHVTDDGSEPVGDHVWDADSSTRCPECGFNGKLKDFRKPPELPPDPENLNDDRAAWADYAITAFHESDRHGNRSRSRRSPCRPDALVRPEQL